MKRKAILIGNTSGLQGVKVDIFNFANYLKSNNGGAWYSSEIDELYDPPKNVLLSNIEAVKRDYPDYVVVMFSGHGGFIRSTILEINGKGESIDESALGNIAKRQLSIFDCCRSYPQRYPRTG